ncbi:MAG: VIT and VWA domain-containing protein [Deltaproteobacteria bacterium]|jgi:Ca-activated chloride channel family protein|nr:VIT and VWA domain-containing protein [Deltaproteobacteria bacterium]
MASVPPTLSKTDGNSPSLVSVQAKGQVEGLFFKMTVTQKYRNDTGHNLELVYTFPLSHGAELMELKFRLGGREMTGVVMEKRLAEETYEETLADGDTPVLVSKSSEGLFTVNLGNLLPGEEAEVEYAYAQLLKVEDGRIRVVVPTAVAERYDDLHETGELRIHESVEVSRSASYPLSLEIDLIGIVSKASVSCPTHIISIKNTKNGRVKVALSPVAWLDRDFVLLLDDLPAGSFALSAASGDGMAVLASFLPPRPEKSCPVLLHVLVDCSQSMAGKGIGTAVRALGFVADNLGPDDYVSLSRFGNFVEHLTRQPFKASPEKIGDLLKHIGTIEANMGGTRLDLALQSTLNDLKDPKNAPKNKALLLITDCQVGGLHALRKTATSAGVRIFTVGVGLSPVESFLRTLSDLTGGSAEFVTPGEEVARPINRIFRHIRTPLPEKARIDWGVKVAWGSGIPKSIFGGDSVNLFAFTDEGIKSPPTLRYEIDGEGFEVQAGDLERTGDTCLARLAGAAQVASLESLELDSRGFGDRGKEILALALKHRLVTAHTNLFLAHKRLTDKADGIPFLQVIPQMVPKYGTIDRFKVADHNLPAAKRLIAPKSEKAPHKAAAKSPRIHHTLQNKAKAVGVKADSRPMKTSGSEWRPKGFIDGEGPVSLRPGVGTNMDKLKGSAARFSGIISEINLAAEKRDASGGYLYGSFSGLLNSPEVAEKLKGAPNPLSFFVDLAGLPQEEAMVQAIALICLALAQAKGLSDRVLKLILGEYPLA